MYAGDEIHDDDTTSGPVEDLDPCEPCPVSCSSNWH